MESVSFEQKMNTSFCENCGKYLHPEHSEVAWIEPGKAISVCSECKRILYAGILKAAREQLHLRGRPPQSSLFATNAP